jgi:hypothetical protein
MTKIYKSYSPKLILKLDPDGEFDSLSGNLYLERMNESAISVVSDGLTMKIYAEKGKLKVNIDEAPEAA